MTYELATDSHSGAAPPSPWARGNAGAAVVFGCSGDDVSLGRQRWRGSLLRSTATRCPEGGPAQSANLRRPRADRRTEGRSSRSGCPSCRSGAAPRAERLCDHGTDFGAGLLECAFSRRYRSGSGGQSSEVDVRRRPAAEIPNRRVSHPADISRNPYRYRRFHYCWRRGIVPHRTGHFFRAPAVDIESRAETLSRCVRWGQCGR